MIKNLSYMFGVSQIVAWSLIGFPLTAYAFQGTLVDETANRALDGIYLNDTTEDKIIYVNFVHPGGSSITAEVRIGVTSPPTSVLYQYTRTNLGARRDTVSFVVPAGEYYGFFGVSASGGGLSIQTWFEYETPPAGGGSDSTYQSIFYGFILFFLTFYFIVWYFRGKAI